MKKALSCGLTYRHEHLELLIWPSADKPALIKVFLVVKSALVMVITENTFWAV